MTNTLSPGSPSATGRDTLSRIAGYHCYRGRDSAPYKTSIRYFEAILGTVDHFRKQAALMPRESIQQLRDIEAGATLTALDDTHRCVGLFTGFDSAGKVHLSESGYALLFAIDCDVEQLAAEIEPIIEQIRQEAAVTELAGQGKAIQPLLLEAV